MSTWWIDEPLLIGSSNPSDADVHDLRGRGFQILVSLLDPNEQSPNYNEEKALKLGYRRHLIPVRDFHPPTLAQLQEFVTVSQGASAETKLLVHCQSGTGRTGTMAAACWISKGLSTPAAIARIRRARPGAVETKKQEERLLEFEHKWHSRSDASAWFGNGAALAFLSV